MATTYIDLVLDTGELVRVECNSKFEDEVYEDITNALKLKGRWSVLAYDGTSATFLGMRMSSVNMARVVGML